MKLRIIIHVILKQLYLTENTLLFSYKVNRLIYYNEINPLNAKLYPICHLLALLGAHPILHVSRTRVNRCNMFSFG